MPPAAVAVYVPHSAKTAAPYEELLALLKKHAAYGAEEDIALVATEVLEVVKRPGATDAERKLALDRLFGSSVSLSDAAAMNIFTAVAQIDDFVASGRKRRDDDDDDDDDDEESEGPELSEADDDAAIEAALVAMQEGQELGGDDDDDGTGPLRVEDVDSSFLLTNMKRLLPSADPADLRQRAERIAEALGDENNPSGVVSTQLLMMLDAWSDPAAEAWVNRLINNRWTVVYALMLAQRAVPAEDVLQRVRSHATRDVTVARLLGALTGSGVAVAGGVASTASLAGVMQSTRSAAVEIDLEKYQFEEGSKLHVKRGKILVPTGTKQRSYATHDEITVPPQPPYKGTDPLVGLSQFAPWASVTFPSYVKTLNPMQSRVFPAAYHTSKNLLVCAPTGAGKTNVAMTTILRELAKHRDNERESFHFDLFKMVYIAPMKALVQEVVRTFGERLAPLGIVVRELSGDEGLSRAELADTQLIVTTPEKWDVITRKGMDRGAAALVRLVIIDEIHLLHSDRGPVLEALVARARRHVASGGGDIRLVGLSATLPNYKDVATFLGIDDLSSGLFFFDSTFRPVPLQQTFVGIKKSKRVAGKASIINEVAYGYAKGFVVRSEPVLVFVHGRKDAATTADYFHRQAENENVARHFARPNSQSSERLKAAAAQAKHAGLKELLPHGVGFHHAGVCRDDRELIETLFLNKDLLCLVCTATLAWGVNLPAHGVIIKGTKVVNAAKGGWDDLSPLDVFQMFGRAGRPGFDTFGEAVIITSSDDLEYYLSLLNQQLPIESKMMSRVLDCLNAEVVLGTVNSLDDAVQWLETTYLYVRMLRSPKLYGVVIEEARRDQSIREHLENCAHTVLTRLHAQKLAHYDALSGEVHSMEIGRIASYYYLSAKSVEIYSRMLKHDIDDVDVFRAFALSSEFEKIASRPDERAELRELLSACPIPVPDPVDKACTKINVLLQAYITGAGLQGFTLMSEMSYVKDSATRIARALLDIALARGLAGTARRVLRFYTEVVRQQWSALSPLRQFDGQLPAGVVRRMEARRVDWDALQTYSVEGGDFDDFAPGQLELQEQTWACVHRVPRFHFEHVSVLPISRSQCKVEIVLLVDFEYIESIHGPSLEALFTIEDSDAVKLLHRERIFLSSDTLSRSPPLAITCIIRVADPKPTHFFARMQVLGWIGSETSTDLPLLGVPLPRLAAPTVMPAGDVKQLEKLDDAWLDAFFVEELSEFSPPQSHVFDDVYRSDDSVFVGLPQGGGRTVITELFLLRALRAVHRNATAAAARVFVYLHPGQSTLRRRQASWEKKLKQLHEFVPDCPATDVVLLPAPYNGLPGDSAAAIRESMKRVGPTGLVIVLATPFAIRGILSAVSRDVDDVVGAMENLVADGVQWIGVPAQAPGGGAASAAPAAFGSSASLGVAYEGALHRFIELGRIRRAVAAKAAQHQQDAPATASAAPTSKLCMLLQCTTTLHAKELCEWARIVEARRYNFPLSSVARCAVIVEPAEAGGRSSEVSPGEQRVLSLLERPKYAVSRVGICVSSPTRVVSLAKLIADTLRNTAIAPYPGVTDPVLARMLPSGVAFVDESISDSDLHVVLTRLRDATSAPPGIATPPAYLPEGSPQELTVVFSSAAADKFNPREFDLLIVAGTATICATPSSDVEMLPLPAPEAVDLPGPLMSLLVSRAAERATIFCSAASADHWRSVIADPTPVLSAADTSRAPFRSSCMRLDATDRILTATEKAEVSFRAVAVQFQDEVLLGVADGTLPSMEHLVRLLASTLLGRSTRANPGWYGLPDGETTGGARDEFFSCVAEAAVNALVDLKCITYAEDTLALKPTLFGVTLARYRVPAASLQGLLDMRTHSTIDDLIRALCAAPFIQSLVPFMTSIDRFPQLRQRRVSTTKEKAAALVDLWLARDATCHPLLREEMRRVVPAVATLAMAAVEVLAKMDWMLARATMGLVQLLIQRCRDSDSKLLQLPAFDQQRVDRCRELASGLLSPDQLPDLDDAVRTAVLDGLSEQDVESVADYCNSLPVIELSATLSLAAAAGDVAVLHVRLAIDVMMDLDPSAPALPASPTPHWVANRRRARWWIAVVAVDSVSGAETLRGLRYLLPSKLDETIAIRVPTPGQRERLIVRAISDTYRAASQVAVA